jgi:adenylate cyclase
MNGVQACRVAPTPTVPSTVLSAADFAAVEPGNAPREEERIVAFIDLVDSTAVAERIGNVRFHGLLSEVLTRLSEIVAAFGGEVHRYVGDALIATWPLGGPLANARAIGCVFACKAALDRAGFDLARRHAHAPRIRASLHCGALALGAIGGREVALVGEAMNTAARIEEACRRTDSDVLISWPLLSRAAVPDDVIATSVGRQLLRGKSERLELFALEEYVAEAGRPDRGRSARLLWACA